MIPFLLVAQLSISTPQERVVVLRDRTGKVTGTLRATGPRPSPSDGLAILCARGRCEPPPPAVDASMPRLIPIRVSRSNGSGPQLLPGPRFTNFVGPSPSAVSIPLPYPTVRIIQ